MLSSRSTLPGPIVPEVKISDVTDVLAQQRSVDPASKKLENIIDAFIKQNEDPSASPNFKSNSKDEIEPFLKLLALNYSRERDEFALRILKILKILARKKENRLSFGLEGVQTVVRFLSQSKNYKVAAEGANVSLNLCYEKLNVSFMLQADAPRVLVAFLEAPDCDLQANAAGALQSVCFQVNGRKYVRDIGAIPVLLDLFGSPNIKVQTRAVGAIHNISSDPDAIRIIRRLDGIAPLVQLLRAPQPAICGSSAGAIQNISREVASRQIIKDAGAVTPLVDLLFGSDVQAQVCAAGALLNILGPDLAPDSATADPAQEGTQTSSLPAQTDSLPAVNRPALKKLLSLSLVLGMAFHGIYTPETT